MRPPSPSGSKPKLAPAINVILNFDKTKKAKKADDAKLLSSILEKKPEELDKTPENEEKPKILMSGMFSKKTDKIEVKVDISKEKDTKLDGKNDEKPKEKLPMSMFTANRSAPPTFPTGEKSKD